jgi:urocanate hydratase
VDVWEKLAEEEEPIVDLGSDQTSLHNPYAGGYYPAGISVAESQKMMVDEP